MGTRTLRYAVALVVVVDFLVAVVQLQQAIIERASFAQASVTTFGQYAVTMSSKTRDDIDLYVRDPHGDIAWFGALQSGAMSLQHDMIPGQTDPVSDGVHELTVIREATKGEYVANAELYKGHAPARVTMRLWNLRGLHKRVVLSRTFTIRYQGSQVTAFRWEVDQAGNVTGHNTLPADLLSAPSRVQTK